MEEAIQTPAVTPEHQAPPEAPPVVSAAPPEAPAPAAATPVLCPRCSPGIHHPPGTISKQAHEAGHGPILIYSYTCPRCGRASSAQKTGLERCICGQPITITD